MSPVQYNYQDERADNLRPRIARFLGWLRSYAEPVEGLNGETIVGVYLAALAEKLGLDGWRMDTFRDRAEMAKISVAYILEGGINCSRILDVFEYAVDGFDVFQLDPWGVRDPRVLTQEEMVEALDRYLHGEPQEDVIEEGADHLSLAIDAEPLLGAIILLGWERWQEMTANMADEAAAPARP